MKEFLEYVDASTSPYTAVIKSAEMLSDKGFEELKMGKHWSLTSGGKYYVKIYDTSIVAFTVPTNVDEAAVMRLCTAHTDYPCLRVKPDPDMQDNGYHRINVECYGGGIWNTWLDRPLSIAGKVVLKSDDVFSPETRIIDEESPVLTIPNLAIHMNSQINKGVELNKQTEMLPIAGLIADGLKKDDYLVKYLADKLEVDAADILDFDLYVYNADKSCEVGLRGELVSAPRLDNLTSCFALIKGIDVSENNINVCFLLDNEEVGSRSKQGADSSLIRIILEKIFDGLGLSSARLNDAIFNSYALSVDVAHAIHPAHPGKSDPKLKVVCGEGFAIKINYSQKYATDTEAIGCIEQLCQKEGIAYQKYVNRSDIAGGSTIGSILSSQIPLRTVDIGVPILAMHSSRELMAGKDLKCIEALITAFMA